MSLQPEELLEEAHQAADGLEDFGGEDFLPALSALCQSLEAEARLSDTGRYLLQQKLVGQLVNRLRVEDWFRRHPEIEDEEIADPVVIVGLPRTGTTKLHRLLACDERLYWMAWWESLYPVPFPDEGLEEPQSRIGQARQDVAMMTSAMPKLAAIHPMDAQAADEEVMLMEHSFLSAFDAYAHLPGYDAWLDEQDQAPAYRYLLRLLKFLQWQKRQRGITGERWVLKSPHHLARMDTLLEIFPGAHIIQTHRDPLQSIPSLASFIHTLWGIYSDQANPRTAGRVWSERMQTALAHTMAVREANPQAQFLDVAFTDTVQRPMDVVGRIYGFLGWELDEATAAAMRCWLEEDERERRGSRHEYSAEQFGLTDEQLRRDFVEYRKKHINEE